MKKLISFIAASALVSSVATAELHKPNRIVEIGTEAEGGFSNNYLAASELLVKNLVLDLQAMEKDVPDSGWNIEMFARDKTFLNVNPTSSFRLGFFAGIESTGNMNIGHELFEVLGSGFSVGESKSMDIDLYGDAYLDAGASLMMKIAGFGITVSPSYYIPLVYIPKTKAKLSCSTTREGEIRARATADLEVFSAFDLARVVGTDEDFVDDLEMAEQFQKALGNGGVDLSIYVERPIFGSMFEVGGFLRVPIVAGKLEYKAMRTVSVDFYQSNFLGKLNDESENNVSKDMGEFSYSKESVRVYRPIRLGAEAVFRPFGKWFELYPMVGLVVRSPYSDDAIFYPEYSLDLKLNLFNVVGASFGTAYLDQVFAQRFGFFINARVLELDAGVSFRSGTFTRSFMGAGMSAFLGVKIGF